MNIGGRVLDSAVKAGSAIEHLNLWIREIDNGDEDFKSDDGAAALKFAFGQLPFRPGTSKNVILVSCSRDDNDMDVYMEDSFYGDALTAAKMHNATVHRMISDEFRFKGGKATKKADRKKLIGYNQVCAHFCSFKFHFLKLFFFK